MSASEPSSPPGRELPESLTRWLRGLHVQDFSAPGPASEPPVSQQSAGLLQRAAQCYARAGWTPEAGRAFERMGDHARAASCHEQMGHWDEAARAYSRASEWESAARCWLRGDRPEDAAECLHKAGQTIEAAWLLADRAGRFGQASDLVGEGLPDEPLDRVAVELIRARCDAGQRPHHARGARRLRDVIAQLAGLTDSRRARLFERAFAVAEALGRPDLAALLHATAVSSRLPGATAHWDRWAEDRLGSPVGIDGPLTESDPAREGSGA